LSGYPVCIGNSSAFGFAGRFSSRRRSTWPLKTLLNSDFFIKCWHYITYEASFFAKLADDELSGCIAVVSEKSQKRRETGDKKYA
jgi:hypothetical protein